MFCFLNEISIFEASLYPVMRSVLGDGGKVELLLLLSVYHYD